MSSHFPSVLLNAELRLLNTLQRILFSGHLTERSNFYFSGKDKEFAGLASIRYIEQVNKTTDKKTEDLIVYLDGDCN